MAAADRITIEIEGRGGHAARPHLSIDTVLVGAQIVNQIQSIVARNVDPLHSAVVSICMFQAGTTDNVIPQTAQLRGTARSFNPQVQDLLETAAARGGRGHGAALRRQGQADLQARLSCDPQPRARRRRSRRRWRRTWSGASASTPTSPPVMGAEDFSFMLKARPGAFIFVGNGDSAGLHHPAYDFNDEVIPVGTSYWVKLVETRRWLLERPQLTAPPRCGCRRESCAGASATVAGRGSGLGDLGLDALASRRTR